MVFKMAPLVIFLLLVINISRLSSTLFAHAHPQGGPQVAAPPAVHERGGVNMFKDTMGYAMHKANAAWNWLKTDDSLPKVQSAGPLAAGSQWQAFGGAVQPKDDPYAAYNKVERGPEQNMARAYSGPSRTPIYWIIVVLAVVFLILAIVVGVMFVRKCGYCAGESARSESSSSKSRKRKRTSKGDRRKSVRRSKRTPRSPHSNRSTSPNTTKRTPKSLSKSKRRMRH